MTTIPDRFLAVIRDGLGVLLCLLPLQGSSSNVSAHFEIAEVAPGVYIHQGRHVSTDHPDRTDIANIGFIIGEECIAVIDSGGSPATGRRLKAAIRDVSDTRICYVINTHIHYDHLLGNAAFVGDDTRFIGHEKLAGSVEQNRGFFREQYGEELGDAAVIGPDRVIKDSIELDLGNRRLTVTAHAPAHTFTDLSVYDDSTRTLWLSDLLFVDHIPVLDGRLKGWLGVMDELEKTPAERVIPGHGPVSAAWPRAADPQRRYLVTLRDEVRDMIAGGKFMETVLDEAAQQEAGRWLLHEHFHRRNVSKAFTELEWE